MNRSCFNVQSSGSLFHDQQGACPADARTIRNGHGFTYIALLAAIVIIGITLGAATKYWSGILQRDKEEELLFRGDQYRQAIEKYRLAIPGRVEYPPSMDELLKDSRTVDGKRYLRRKYKDPVSGEEFVEVRDQFKRIIGVHSPSEKEPIKQSNFPDQYRDFEGKQKYSEWIFSAASPTAIVLPAVKP